MLFSVLVAVYNAEEYLDRCVESILNQTEQDFEVVLVDDCSKDKSGEICRKYVARYPEKIRYIHHEGNQGLLLARRTLFENARGEWFISVDADDWIEKETLAVIKEVVEKKNVDLVLYDLTCVQLDGRSGRFLPKLKADYIYTGKEKEDVYTIFLETYDINSMCTKAIHRSIIDYEVDYSQWKFVKQGEDQFQSYPIFDKAKSIIYVDRALYNYIKRENSISTSFKENDYYALKALWEKDDIYRLKWFGDNDRNNRNETRKKTLFNYSMQAVQHRSRRQFTEIIKRMCSDEYLFGIISSPSGDNEKVFIKVSSALIKSQKYNLLWVFLKAYATLLKLYIRIKKL